MRWGGRCKAKLIGTFSISSLGGQGCLNSFHPLITTSSIAFGPIDGDHRMRVVLLCDHRTLDGMLGAKALKSLNLVLQTQILHELQSLESRNQAA
jgi:pyruvate/2-oxoglutarate dehydrogenase complex dihydrolipoamide acyltransferase (E2) component